MTNRSTFPTTLDVFTESLDLSNALKVSATRWQTLKLQASLTPTEQAEFDSLTTTLAPYLFTPEKLNLLQDCMANMESFIDSTFKNYYKYIGVYDPAITYAIYNTVSYNSEVYMALQSTTGNLPTNATYWLKIGSQGVKGDKGDDGVNLVYKDTYDNTYAYNINDLVIYNNIAYSCIQASIGNLPIDTEYWSVFLSPPSTLNGKTASGTLDTTEQTDLAIAINEVLTDINEVLDDTNYPFKIKSAIYTSGTDTLSIVISDGVGETFNGTTIYIITKTTDTTFTITPVTASTTYTIYLKNDGNFASSTDGTTTDGSITIGTVTTSSDKSVNTIVDKRPLVSGVGKELITHENTQASQTTLGHIKTINVDSAGNLLISGSTIYLYNNIGGAL